MLCYLLLSHFFCVLRVRRGYFDRASVNEAFYKCVSQFRFSVVTFKSLCCYSLISWPCQAINIKVKFPYSRILFFYYVLFLRLSNLSYMEHTKISAKRILWSLYIQLPSCNLKAAKYQKLVVILHIIPLGLGIDCIPNTHRNLMFFIYVEWRSCKHMMYTLMAMHMMYGCRHSHYQNLTILKVRYGWSR